MSIANAGYFTADTDAAADKGMRTRVGEVITTGTFLARFTKETDAAGPLKLTGNWWWEFTEVRKTFQHASQSAQSIQDSIRANAAIVNAFRNNCSMMVCVRTRVALGAYLGKGKFVDSYGALDAKGRPSDMQVGNNGGTSPFGGAAAAGDVGIPDPYFEQLFIPGLKTRPKEFEAEAIRNGAEWLEFKKAFNLEFVSRLLASGDFRAINLPQMLWQL